jgi:hypothetical protein
VKIFVLATGLGFKRHFLSDLINSSRQIRLKNQVKNRNVTQGGGVEKVPKKCHILFERPLSRKYFKMADRTSFRRPLFSFEKSQYFSTTSKIMYKGTN